MRECKYWFKCHKILLLVIYKMVKTVILTSANYVGNSTFKYSPLTPIRAPDDIAACAISSIEF